MCVCVCARTLLQCVCVRERERERERERGWVGGGQTDRQTVKVSVCAFITWETFARWRSQPIVAGPDRVAGAYVLENRKHRHTPHTHRH